MGGAAASPSANNQSNSVGSPAPVAGLPSLYPTPVSQKKGTFAMTTLNLVYVIRSFKRLWAKEASTLFGNPVDQAAEQLRNSLSQDILLSLNGRFERGVTLAKQGAVSPHMDANLPDKRRLFQVKSANPSSPPYYYLVDLDGETCECPDHWKGHFCKHLIASHLIEIVQTNRQKAASSKPQSLPDNLRFKGQTGSTSLSSATRCKRTGLRECAPSSGAKPGNYPTYNR